MKVILIGANGQLGSDIGKEISITHTLIPLCHEDGDITDKDAFNRIFAENDPDAVINTAAMHNVEACENNPERAHQVNGTGTKNLAELCRERDIPFLHISTDYVFDGLKGEPYTEEDEARPLNVYGKTKLEGENLALSAWENTAIIRVGGIYGHNPCRAKNGLNFVQLMLKLAKERPEIRVVDDEIVTPTPTSAIARQVVKILENKLTGVIHATAQGQCSWYEFARAIFQEAGLAPNLQKALPGEFPAKVQRPQYSVLENKRLKAAGIDTMPNWKEGLGKYLKVSAR